MRNCRSYESIPVEMSQISVPVCKWKKTFDGCLEYKSFILMSMNSASVMLWKRISLWKTVVHMDAQMNFPVSHGLLEGKHLSVP